jgi:hypothetical protein
LSITCDAAVAARAFAVRDKEVAIAAVDEDRGRHVENGGVGIERLALLRSIRGIEFPLRADLHQHLLSVMGVFLDHAGRRRATQTLPS